jgi:hypothetical protein
VSGPELICRVRLGRDHRLAHRAPHLLPSGEVMPTPAELRVTNEETSFHLGYHDGSGREMTRTTHPSLRDALHQATFEFEVQAADWEVVATRHTEAVRGSDQQERLFFVREKEVRRRLRRFDELGRIAFAAACCERLVPAFLEHSKGDGPWTPTFLRGALDAVWTGLADGDFSRVPPPRGLGLDEDELDPDEDPCDFEDYGAPATVFALHGLLDGARRGDGSCADRASTWAFEHLAAHLHETVPGRSDPDVDAHPLMVQEFSRQLADLDALEASSLQEAVALVRRRCSGASILDPSGR